MSNKFSFVAFSIILGFLGGIAGVIISQNYILEKVFNVPLYGDVNVNQGNGGANVIIREAKNVVVEQNKKIHDTVNMVSPSIVGIFKKKEKSTLAEVDLLDDLYYKKDNISNGYIVTSDGWIMADFFDKRLVAFSDKDPEDISTTTIKKISDDYIVLLGNDNAYEINDIFINKDNTHLFLRIDAKDLPVRPTANIDYIKNGELVVATSWANWTWTTTIFNVVKNEEYIRNSDVINEELILNNPEQIQENSYIFNLNGEIIAFVDENKKINILDDFSESIKQLMGEKVLKKAKFGVNYVNLATVASMFKKQVNGALVVENEKNIAVVKDSPADKAGVLEGDIIISIDDIIVRESSDLNYIIEQFKVGNDASLVILRGEQEIELVVNF